MKNTDNNFEEIVQTSFNKLNDIYELLVQEEKSQYSHRRIFSISAYQICLAHCRSTIFLLMHGQVATPLSLLRVSFEAFIRARWIYKVASDDELKEFKEKKNIKFPAKNKILDSIEIKYCLDGDALNASINEHKLLFDDFTHTGDMQIIRRVQETVKNINETFIKSEIKFVIEFTSYLYINSVINILEVDNRKDKIMTAVEKYLEFNKWLKMQ